VFARCSVDWRNSSHFAQHTEALTWLLFGECKEKARAAGGRLTSSGDFNAVFNVQVFLSDSLISELIGDHRSAEMEVSCV
jgi:hypothetical protein